jgi:hypothetical protein
MVKSAKKKMEVIMSCNQMREEGLAIHQAYVQDAAEWRRARCDGLYIKRSDVHEVGEVDVMVVAMTTLSRWIPNLTDRSTLNRIQ